MFVSAGSIVRRALTKRVCLSDILGMSQMRGSGVLHVCTTEVQRKKINACLGTSYSLWTLLLQACRYNFPCPLNTAVQDHSDQTGTGKASALFELQHHCLDIMRMRPHSIFLAALKIQLHTEVSPLMLQTGIGLFEGRRMDTITLWGCVQEHHM